MLVADPHSPDFNTYASVVDLRAFAAGRGYTVPADDGECGQMLMQAMDYLEGKSWRGQRSAHHSRYPGRAPACASMVLTCRMTLSRSAWLMRNAAWPSNRRRLTSRLRLLVAVR
jgi:hypothetical protein